METNKNHPQKDLKSILSSWNKNTIGILICAVVLILTLVIFLLVRGSNGDSSKNRTEKSPDVTESMTVEDYADIGDSNTSTVTTDAKDSGEVWKTMKDETYNCEVEASDDGYSGKYYEDGSDDKVSDIMTLTFTNDGSKDIQYAEYVYSLGEEVVSFKLSSLPVGQSCQVLEASKHKNDTKNVLKLISRVVVQVDELPFARDELAVVDNGDNTITIMNMTEKEIPSARVFYKYFDSEKNVYLGGITYTAKAEKIPAGGRVKVSPAHFVSGESVIVGSGVYEK